MGLIWKNADDEDVREILCGLRPHCRRELLGQRHSLVDYFEELKLRERQTLLRVVLMLDDGVPIALVAVYHMTPALASFQVLSTERWWEIAGNSFVRWVKRTVIPGLIERGYRMCEFHVLDDKEFDARWFALMNVKQWGEKQPRGIHGELYRPMVWLNPKEVADVRSSESSQSRLYARWHRRRRGAARSAERPAAAAGAAGGGGLDGGIEGANGSDQPRAGGLAANLG